MPKRSGRVKAGAYGSAGAGGGGVSYEGGKSAKFESDGGKGYIKMKKKKKKKKIYKAEKIYKDLTDAEMEKINKKKFYDDYEKELAEKYKR